MTRRKSYILLRYQQIWQKLFREKKYTNETYSSPMKRNDWGATSAFLETNTIRDFDQRAVRGGLSASETTYNSRRCNPGAEFLPELSTRKQQNPPDTYLTTTLASTPQGSATHCSVWWLWGSSKKGHVLMALLRANSGFRPSGRNLVGRPQGLTFTRQNSPLRKLQ